MTNSIAISNANSEILAIRSTLFCISNGITFSEEVVSAIANAVSSYIASWYVSNGKGIPKPNTELIESEAIDYAFDQLQQLADIAHLAAEMGMRAEDFQ
jgi:hypothetical protein